jgi:hypothetical protein
VDEGPAAHLDQRMIQGVKDNKYQECVRANILAPCLLGAQYRPSLYINIHQQTQYSLRLGSIMGVQIPFILLTSSQYALVYIEGYSPPSTSRRK